MLAKLLVGFAGLLLAAGTNTPQTGAYTTKDGSQCTWFDLRTSQSKISLATACVCRDYKGRPQSYGCQYTGDLYTCDEFKAQTRDILLGLVDQLAALNNSCELPQLFAPVCSEIILEREMLHEVESPCTPNPPTGTHQEL